MKWLLGLLVVLIVIPFLLVINLPASLLPTAIEEAYARGLIHPEAPKLELENLSGTLWDGQAERAVLHIDGAAVSLGVATWQIKSQALMKQTLAFDVQTKADNQQLSASVSIIERGEVTVKDVEGRLPISVLEPWFPMLVSGDISFVFDHVVFTQLHLLAIDGLLNIEYVDWLGGDYTMPLGSYLAQVYLDGSSVQVKIDDFSGGLGVDGLLSISPQGLYRFDATLTPRDTLAPEVTETLSWLGQRSVNGDILMTSEGHF